MSCCDVVGRSCSMLLLSGVGREGIALGACAGGVGASSLGGWWRTRGPGRG